MNLLDGIRSDLTNETADISNTLRKAKILASALGLPEFREWVDFELGGYPDPDRVPSYRRHRPINLGTFLGPFNSSVNNMVLPTATLPDSLKEFAETLVFADGVGALKAQGESTTQRKWPQEVVVLARDYFHVEGMALADAHQPIPTYVISGILDQVKNKLLDFVLGLQESNITPEDLDSRKVESDVVRNLYNIHIHGDRNIVASGEHVEQRVNNVQRGDIDSLISFLRELNVDDGDLSKLKDAVSSETMVSKGHYGPKVAEWFGGMISKAAVGAWKVSLNNVSKVLTDAINAYYGVTPPA